MGRLQFLGSKGYTISVVSTEVEPMAAKSDDVARHYYSLEEYFALELNVISGKVTAFGGPRN